MNKKTIGTIQMITCAALWSIAGIFIKLIDGNSFVIAGFRSLFATITVLLYMFFTKTKIVINKKTIISGLIMMTIFFMFVTANKLTTAANAIVLQFTAPIFLMIYQTLINHTKFSSLDIITVLFTLLGISLCFFSGLEISHLLGNVVAVLSGAVMALMYFYVGKVEEQQEKISGILFGQVFTTIVGISLYPFTENNFVAVSVLYLLILGVFQLGIPYILYGLASKKCSDLACCLLSAVEPILNPIWVAIFVGERPSFICLVGSILVICVVTIWCIYDNQ